MDSVCRQADLWSNFAPTRVESGGEYTKVVSNTQQGRKMCIMDEDTKNDPT